MDLTQESEAITRGEQKKVGEGRQIGWGGEGSFPEGGKTTYSAALLVTQRTESESTAPRRMITLKTTQKIKDYIMKHGNLCFQPLPAMSDGTVWDESCCKRAIIIWLVQHFRVQRAAVV